VQFGEAQRHLEAHGSDPNFLLCLAYILAQTTSAQVRPDICSSASHAGVLKRGCPVRVQVADDVRQLGGLLLKNYVIRNRQAFLAAGSDFQGYIKSQVGRGHGSLEAL
jgi:hypothetical protein